MSHRSPVGVSERHAFDAVIDARSPAEFAIDHIPGAVNYPVLNDEERVIVGTLYKQQGAFEARRVGGAFVAANLAKHLQGPLADRPARWKPLIYCWRGGMRSGAMVTWLRMVGWDAQQLQGGYKSWRRHVIDLIETLAPQLPLRVLCGPTGSAKTRILQALAERGEQVLDLEGFASHKGSLLGNLPGIEQPSQKRFETLIAEKLEQFDLSRPVYLEGESAKIGRIGLPLVLVSHLHKAPVIEVRATESARLSFLLRDYAYLGDEPDALADKLGWLKELHGNVVISRWQEWARTKELSPLFEELMLRHYDPHYERSQSNHFVQWPQRQVLETDDLSDAGIAKLAQQVRALQTR